MDTGDGFIFSYEPPFNLGDRSGAYLHAVGFEDEEPGVRSRCRCQRRTSVLAGHGRIRAAVYNTVDGCKQR
jgi:hypothetical protein